MDIEIITSYGHLKDVTGLVFERLDSLSGEDVTKNQKFRALNDLYKSLESFGLTSFFKVLFNKN